MRTPSVLTLVALVTLTVVTCAWAQSDAECGRVMEDVVECLHRPPLPNPETEEVEIEDVAADKCECYRPMLDAFRSITCSVESAEYGRLRNMGCKYQRIYHCEPPLYCPTE